MDTPKKIALVAHDDKKHDLLLPDYHGYRHRMDDDPTDQEQEALVA